MNHIEVAILEDSTIQAAERLMVTAARLTQRNEKITGMDDLLALHSWGHSPVLVKNLCKLPHPTLQKFGTITIAIVGASRRFLAQITRHQNEVKYMSGSLQYSDMSGAAQFVVPYEMIADAELSERYHDNCEASLREYEDMVAYGCDHDAAGYLMPQGMRNTLLISATPYQWKHMIKQRVCRRNTSETRWVMLKCWEKLLEASPTLFSDLGAPCQVGYCPEGSMSCKSPIPKELTPTEIMQTDYPLMYELFDVT